MSLGPHATFILWAYGLTALVVGGLLAHVLVQGRRLQKRLDDLEARGIRRRSAGAE
jgi:heme exporter protein D